MDKSIRLVLEFDDFSPRNTNLGLIEELKEHFPGFKVTMFTVPWEIRWGEWTPITDPKFKPFCDACIKAQDWLEVAVHGLSHLMGEFKSIDYEEAKKRVMIAEKFLINKNIPYAKIFKAPGWELSTEGRRAVEDLGFKVVDDGYYNWNLKDERPVTDEVIIGHGHIQLTMGNGVEQVFDKLMKLPTSTEFMFLSEYLKADKVFPEEMTGQFRKEGIDHDARSSE